MGIVSIVTSVICKSLRNANKNKVCTCPRCKHAIIRYPEHIEERSVDSPLLIRCPSCGNIVHDPLAAERGLLPREKAFKADIVTSGNVARLLLCGVQQRQAPF